jgi:chromatin remodeling complex protein RSC6
MDNDNVVLFEEEVDPIAQQFEAVLASLANFRTQVTAVQQQLRGLEKTVSREVKLLKKEKGRKKNKSGVRKPSGFAKPAQVSAELCSFMQRELGTEIARTEVTQYIIKYIREHALQNTANRRVIEPDAELMVLLGAQPGDEVTYFNLQKYMNRHFHRAGQTKTPTSEQSPHPTSEQSPHPTSEQSPQ